MRRLGDEIGIGGVLSQCIIVFDTDSLKFMLFCHYADAEQNKAVSLESKLRDELKATLEEKKQLWNKESINT